MKSGDGEEGRRQRRRGGAPTANRNAAAIVADEGEEGEEGEGDERWKMAEHKNIYKEGKKKKHTHTTPLEIMTRWASVSPRRLLDVSSVSNMKRKKSMTTPSNALNGCFYIA